MGQSLRGDGIDVTLDRWHTAPGDKLPQFMETSIRENTFVLIVLTPAYKYKSDNRKGGVGYEGDIMTGEVFAGKDPRKFIPILRKGDWNSAAPSWLAGKYGIDLRDGPHFEENYGDLFNTLHGTRETAPPLGKPPMRTSGVIFDSQATFTPPPLLRDDEPIRILNIIASEVGTPRNDGTRGSALYAVPFQLSRRPSAEWAEHFVRTWDRPPSSSTKHRPGIAHIDGDRLILERTTVEEVADVHRDTLKAVLEKVNQDIAEHEHQERQLAERRAEELHQHKKTVEETARRITFDEGDRGPALGPRLTLICEPGGKGFTPTARVPGTFTKKGGPEVNARYVRIAVKGEHFPGSSAKSCRVNLTGIKRFNSAGSLTEISFAETLRLRWAYEGPDSDPHVGRDIPNGALSYVDVFSSQEAVTWGHKRDDQNLILEVAAENAREAPELVNLLSSNSSYRFSITATADGVEPVNAELDVKLGEKWDQVEVIRLITNNIT
jgi:hypothetical protein